MHGLPAGCIPASDITVSSGLLFNRLALAQAKSSLLSHAVWFFLSIADLALCHTTQSLIPARGRKISAVPAADLVTMAAGEQPC